MLGPDSAETVVHSLLVLLDVAVCSSSHGSADSDSGLSGMNGLKMSSALKSVVGRGRSGPGSAVSSADSDSGLSGMNGLKMSSAWESVVGRGLAGRGAAVSSTVGSEAVLFSSGDVG